MKIVTLRIQDDIIGIIKEVAARRGEDVSSFIRRAILKELARLGYLSDETRKALEV